MFEGTYSMAIYTRYGDQGYTRLVGGGRAKKNDPRVITYGSIDTLNSQLGFTVSLLAATDSLRAELIYLQQRVFNCSSDFAVPDEKRPYKVTAEMISWLEGKIDFYWENTQSVDRFVLPGGSQVAISLHLCRCFAREAERNAVTLMDDGGTINLQAFAFLNRLSDYFFALARWQNQHTGTAEILYEDSQPVFDRRRKKDVPNHDAGQK